VTALVLSMARADLLKLRKKRGTLIWALVLALAPVIVYYAVATIEHASNSATEPAGGVHGLHIGLRLLGGLFFGPLVAILIGVEAGTGDHNSGVFRDLVVTGRLRHVLFATRIPAALGLCWSVIVAAYALIVVGAFVFADGTPTPSGALILNGLGFVLLSSGVVCAVAVGFASLTTSKPAAIIALIAWQIIAGPIITNISSLGGARDLVLSQATAHFAPLAAAMGHGSEISMSGGTAVLVIALWLAVFVGLGAWRTRAIDA
jgi:ABC-type transport system involved in multi-copper enzyme maturation permease subunit